jgi:chromosomal replication initiation ATPase DnaA
MEQAMHAELFESTDFRCSSHPLIDTLESALREVAALPAEAAPAIVSLAQRWLAALERIRAAGSLAHISQHVAREFRLYPDDLQGRSRAQRIAFARQVAIYICRKITAKSFPVIGEYFNRDHSTAVYAFHMIERRVHGDAAFRLFVEKLELQITGTAAAGTAAAAAWISILDCNTAQP